MVQGFDFRLSRVLDIRNIREDIAENKLNQARTKARKTEQKLNTMSRTQQELYNYIRNNNNNLTLEGLLHSRSYLMNNREKIDKVQERLQARRQEVENKKQVLIEKRRGRQVLEKLKEKDYRKFYRNYQRREQKKLDEVGLISRKRNQEGQI